ncbi:MAG: putative DNA-binding domain-containing protein [Pseudorhodobacter sp.]|nr:putative DNA-binding domain-containing protein [Pseudorhodobacter sp.]
MPTFPTGGSSEPRRPGLLWRCDERSQPCRRTDGARSARPAGSAIYPNSVTTSLIRNLHAGLPVVRQMVGDEFFDAMATEVLRTHAPRGQLMMLHGYAPSGLATFPPAVTYFALCDVESAEQSLRESYHAVDP